LGKTQKKDKQNKKTQQEKLKRRVKNINPTKIKCGVASYCLQRQTVSYPTNIACVYLDCTVLIDPLVYSSVDSIWFLHY
jgi:hypothetical protein